MKNRWYIAFLLALTLVIGVSALTRHNSAKLNLTTKAPAQLPPQTETDTVRFIAFGDMGTGDNEQYALAQQMAKWHDAHPYDTALLLGDNIYPDGNPADLPAKFEKPYAELLRRGIRFQASLGNHDVRKGREGQMNYPNFNMGGHAYYSFVKGTNSEGKSLAEFFALDSNNMDAAQLKWLEGALAASKATWKLAFYHHPIYSSATTHGSDTSLRAKLEPLFVRYGVKAVFSGHDHVYERTKPLKGVQYFTSGAGSGKLRRGDLDRRSSFFATGNDETGSFLYVEATREQLSFQAVDAAGKVFDQGALTTSGVAEVNTPLTVPSLSTKGEATRNEKPAEAETNSENSKSAMSDKHTDKSDKEAEKKARHDKKKEEKEQKKKKDSANS